MKYLTDHKSKPSAMRLMSIFSLATAIGLALVQALTDAPTDNTVVLYFLGAAFAPKCIQSFAEQQNK